MKVTAENYIERSDGAILLTINSSKIFFSHGKVIAIVTGDVLYRTYELDSGIVYRRIKAALGRQPVKHVNQVTRPELNTMIEAIIVNAGIEHVDSQLLKEEKQK